MTDEEKRLLSAFETRLRHLLYLHEEQQRKLDELQGRLAETETRLEELQNAHNELQQRYNDLKSAMTISLNDSDVKETKLRLSQLVREVDKCIALLNE